MANLQFTPFIDTLHSGWCYIADIFIHKRMSMTDHNTNRREQRKSKILPHIRENIKKKQHLRGNIEMFMGYL